ncbi:MAG: homocitrate synthase [Chloroflexi bacterium UTCFX4]|jgi:homocitrate synthase|nr:MAG: homocitrate synthase [Chloroflexi bacterium UTCFX4]
MSLEKFNIIESTLREGEQFVGANFTIDDKVRIADALDEFGVEYLELTSPLASPASRDDCELIARRGLKAKILTHIRCHQDDAKIALDTGVGGLDVVIGTSSMLREFSHGKSIDEIIQLASEVLTWIRAQAPEIELRFSTEDSFRSEEKDLMRVYLAVDKLGVVNRLGIADTVGVATPRRVYELISSLRRLTHADIEFHGHNDTGCAIANSFSALDAGATHIDTSVLGIGERNGITPLGGFVARMYAHNKAATKKKYKLKKLRKVDQLVAEMVGVAVPFNNYITGVTAFTHKAGIHSKAILNKPETYEILDPQDFGLTRYISIAHKLTGWNAIKDRAEQLGLELSDAQIKLVTAEVKALADIKQIDLEDVDELLHRWAEEQTTGDSSQTADDELEIENRVPPKASASNGKQLAKQSL